jgi:hypothetical protein
LATSWISVETEKPKKLGIDIRFLTRTPSFPMIIDVHNEFWKFGEHELVGHGT